MWKVLFCIASKAEISDQGFTRNEIKGPQYILHDTPTAKMIYFESQAIDNVEDTSKTHRFVGDIRGAHSEENGQSILNLTSTKEYNLDYNELPDASSTPTKLFTDVKISTGAISSDFSSRFASVEKNSPQTVQPIYISKGAPYSPNEYISGVDNPQKHRESSG